MKFMFRIRLDSMCEAAKNPLPAAPTKKIGKGQVVS